MRRISLFMRIGIGMCMVSFLIALYDRFGDNDKSENLSTIINASAAIGLILMALSDLTKKKKS